MIKIVLLIILTALNPLAWIATLWRYYQTRKNVKNKTNLLTLGNISFGGTGKTPMVIWLNKQLQLAGIISKSYKATANIAQQVDPLVSCAEEIGDEALLLAHRLDPVPVFSGPNKSLTLDFAQFQRPNGNGWWVVDDGYQHFIGRAQRQIILWDVTDLSAFAMWPWGRGREPIWSLSQADAIVLTKCQWLKPAQLQKIRWVLSLFFKKPQALFQSYYHEVWPEVDSGTKIIGVAGLAKNELFFKALKTQYPDQIVSCLGFPDHCRYQTKELAQIQADLFKWPQAIILTTAKDLIKLQATELHSRLRLVDIQVTIDNSDEFIKILSS